jgi:hypothetical protein
MNEENFDVEDELATPPKPLKKVIKKRATRRKKGSTTKLYFNADTQAAMVAYQTATTSEERNKLYNTELRPAFEKLTENLINIHKFTSVHDSYDDLKNDCVTFLYETIFKFDNSRGSNAFSYMNVCAKNFLIIRTKQKAQRLRRSVSIDDADAMTLSDKRTIADAHIVPSQETVLESKMTVHNIISVLYEIRAAAKSENELACINSIITVFENIHDIDLLNRSAVMLYIRELSGLSPKQLTTAMQLIKRQYRRLKLENRLPF